MASIIKRKSKYSVVYYFIDEKGEKRQKWETCQDYAEAKRRKAEIENQLNTGTFIPPQELTVKNFLKDFVQIYGKAHWALSTFQSNTALISNYINPTIGDELVQNITPKYVDAFYVKLQSVKSVVDRNRTPKSEYLTPGVIHSIHKILRCAFDQAVKWEIIARNPFPHANKPKNNYKKREIWTADMIRTALDQCDDMKLYVAMNLSFACSMRLGEITGLTWDKVHITDEDIANDDAHLNIDQELARVSREARELLDDKDIIRIFPSVMSNTHTNLVLKTPKTESSVRKVWMPRTVAYILKEWKEIQDKYREYLGSDYFDYNLVLTLPNGRPVESRVIDKEFHKLKEKAALPNVVFHSLRHSSTTYKLKLNHGDLKATQGDTGHSQIDMITDVYAHILDEDRKVNAQKFEATFYAKNGGNPLKNVTAPENENPELTNLIAALHQSPELVSVLTQALKGNAISTN